MLDLAALVDDAASRADVTAVEMAELFGEAARAANDVLNAFITLTPEAARADAARVDAARAAGSPLPLDGMPITVKDNMDLAGWPTTAASRSTSDAPATVDAEAVRRVREAGGVVIGKANLHELAFGMTTTNPPPFGVTLNPWDHGRIAGGSSGGTAAAVAADLSVGGLGTDTGGSIRVPSALTGLTGLRPTFGRISTRGVFPLSWTFDTAGPIARSADDAGLLYRVMAGWDPEDPRSEPSRGGEDEQPRGARTCAGIRFGIAGGFFHEGVAPEVIATGEIHATRSEFRDIIGSRACAVVQPDVCVVGGIGEWLAVAAMARASDIQVAPHWNANVHVHLVAAVDALCVEYFAPEEGIFNFESLVTERLQVRDGALVLPRTPGVGLAFDPQALERYSV